MIVYNSSDGLSRPVPDRVRTRLVPGEVAAAKEVDGAEPVGIVSSGIQVLLVVEHAVLRTGLKALLQAEPDLCVVGEAGTGGEALPRVLGSNPAVAVLDLAMPGMSGLDAAERITTSGQRTRVLGLTMHAGEEYLLPILQVGGSGYVCKATAADDLVRAIRTAARDEVFLYPSAARLLLRRYEVRKDSAMPARLEALTNRERAVFRLTARGFSSHEVGRTLGTAAENVDACRWRVVEKLGLNRRSVLVGLAETGRLEI